MSESFVIDDLDDFTSLLLLIKFIIEFMGIGLYFSLLVLQYWFGYQTSNVPNFENFFYAVFIVLFIYL